MPTGLPDRLSQLCVALNLTLPDLTRILRQPEQRIQRLLDGQGRVSPKLQARVLEEFPALNPSWLLAGEGPMFRVTPHVPTVPTGNHLAANYGHNIQIINSPPAPCRCCCTISALRDHLQEKERVIQLLLHHIQPSNKVVNAIPGETQKDLKSTLNDATRGSGTDYIAAPDFQK